MVVVEVSNMNEPFANPRSRLGSEAALLALLDNKVRIPRSTTLLKIEYKQGQPFPHLVIDGFFADELLEPLLTEVAAMRRDQWQTIGESGLQKVMRMRSGVELGKAGQELVNILHSAPFLYLLSELTGIWQLLPDPYLQGGGNAVMALGDYFKIHSDRSIAYDTGLTRRLAMVIFLNKDWDSAFGGQLELWDNDAKNCLKSIEPVFNRTVIFEVKDPNYHGVPTPITCPPDRIRQSFLIYFHTVGTDGGGKVTPHTSLFAPGFYREKKPLLQLTIEQITPPLIVQTAKRVIRWIKPKPL